MPADTHQSNTPLMVIIAVVAFALGFFMGSMWTENKMLKEGSLGGTALGTTPTAQAPTETGPTAEQLAAVPPVTGEDHIIGRPDAPVVLVEYSDFECPYCQRFHPTTKQLLSDYGDDIALVYRHYPLSFHDDAQKAAEGSECVAKLGGEEAFWSYADAIFAINEEMGGKLEPESITQAATEAGVNEAAFTECLDSGEMADLVKTQLSEGTAAGVTGTPATFIMTADGAQELISGALPVEQIKPMIDQYL
ncbi:MAG: DsbA family protein [Pseudomonadales bacterium]|nr:DsbA family protein [Candidatus Woesebacteria bacterium]MCB9801669.1 DsbA family protein [Pseudomonadales bacterium]